MKLHTWSLSLTGVGSGPVSPSRCVSPWMETPVYDRYALGPGASFDGPAIVEERESTAVIGPGARCRVDEGLTIVVTMP